MAGLFRLAFFVIPSAFAQNLRGGSDSTLGSIAQVLENCPSFIYDGFCDRADITGGAACLEDDVISGDKNLTDPSQIQCANKKVGGVDYKCKSGSTKCLGPPPPPTYPDSSATGCALEDVCDDVAPLENLADPHGEWRGGISPRCYQVKLSATHAHEQADWAKNSDGEVFPQPLGSGGSAEYCKYEDVLKGTVDASKCTCPLKLGAEYGWDYCPEVSVNDFTAKSMAERQLNVGAYDTAGFCDPMIGNMGDPGCCNFFGEREDARCWSIPNSIPGVEGKLLRHDLDPSDSIPMVAQYAGCVGPDDKGAMVPYTDKETYCQNAVTLFQSGCEHLSAMNVAEGINAQEDCFSSVNPRINESMYVYNLPPLGAADGQELAHRTDSLYNLSKKGTSYTGFDVSIYNTDGASAEHPELAPASAGGFGLDKDGNPLGEFSWAFKQMHGKGFTCLNARMKVLDEAEELALKSKKIPTLPKQFRIGLFEKTGADSTEGRQWPVLLRFAGNRNSTIYDWHDVRVNGLAIKIYGAGDVTGEDGEHRVKLSKVPRTDYAGNGDAPKIEVKVADDPDNTSAYFAGLREPYTVASIQKAKDNFNGDLEEFQNETTVDLLFIAIRGQRQQHCMTNTPDCVYNIFPAGGNAICYMPQFLYGNNTYNCKPDPSVVTHSTWNALNYTFGSAAPYKLGKNMAMKITTQPCGKDESSDGTDYWSLINDTIKDPFNPNFRFENMRNTLVNTSFELCVFVQLQENPCTEPVEQADVNWQTPHRLVARIYIPKGEPPRYDNRCDNTAMHPYRTLTDHMPLGSLQRIRNTVYSYAQTFRLNRNHGKSLSSEELLATQMPYPPASPAPAPIKCPLGFV